MGLLRSLTPRQKAQLKKLAYYSNRSMNGMMRSLIEEKADFVFGNNAKYKIGGDKITNN